MRIVWGDQSTMVNVALSAPGSLCRDATLNFASDESSWDGGDFQNCPGVQLGNTKY